MEHQIVSVYFPSKLVLDEINLHLVNNCSQSAFIVKAVEEKLQRMRIAKGDKTNDANSEAKTEEDNNK